MQPPEFCNPPTIGLQRVFAFPLVRRNYHGRRKPLIDSASLLMEHSIDLADDVTASFNVIE